MSRASLSGLMVASVVVGSYCACARSGGAPVDAAIARDAGVIVSVSPRVGDTDSGARASDGGGAAAAGALRPVPSALGEKLMSEIQDVVDHGGNAARMGQIIAEYTGQPDALIARKTALYVLKSLPSRAARLAALLEGGSATPVAPEDDPLWGQLVGVLSETWARENIGDGRRRMLRESRPRAQRLLVSSIAIYAASNRGLSDLRSPARKALSAEFMRLYPHLPQEQQRDIDAALPKLADDARKVR